MKNMWKSKWIAGGIAAIAMALLVSGVFLFLRSGRQISVKHVFYVENGETVSSEGKSWRLTFDQKKGTTLKGAGIRKNLTDDGTLIYYEYENKVLLPQTDCLQYAAGDKIYRLEYFTTVELTDDGYKIKDGASSVTVQNGIIYDGKDTYLFLEPVTLTIDGEERKLPALSMIHAVFANRMDLYPYGSDPEAIPLYVDSDVKVSFSEGRTLMPLTDRVLMENQSWQLMSTSYKILQRIDAWKD